MSTTPTVSSADKKYIVCFRIHILTVSLFVNPACKRGTCLNQSGLCCRLSREAITERCERRRIRGFLVFIWQLLTIRLLRLA